MKTLGTYKRMSVNEDGDLEITFAISNYLSKKECQLLKKEQIYSLDIEEKKDRKTLQQNRYLWKLCSLLAQKINGDNDAMNIYCDALVNASIKCEYYMALPEAEKTLKKAYRVVRQVDKRNYNGVEMIVYQVFAGSSKFNKEEEGKIIDYLLDLAEVNEMNIDYWEGMIK